MITTIQTLTRRYAFAALLAVAVLFTACDSTNIAPANEGRAGTSASAVSISFASTLGGEAEKAFENGRITDAAGRVIELRSVELVLRDVKFKSPGDNGNEEREAEVGPFLIDVPLDSLPEIQIETELPSGIWDRLELEIDDPSDEDNIDFPKDASIRVKGAWTPLNGPTTEFTFLSDAEGEREIQLSPPLEVGEPSTYNVTLMVDLDRWFRDADGTLLDPASANEDGPNEDRVEDNIEASFEGFEDNNQDGEDDPPRDDRGDDDRSDDDRSDDDDASDDRRDDDNSSDDSSDDSGREIEMRGPIKALGDSTITVGGRTWVIIEETRITDEDDASLALADLQVDDFVEVEGIERSGTLLAKKVKRKVHDGFDDDQPGAEIEVEGLIEALGDSTITVLGQTWEVVPETRIQTDDGAQLAFGELLVDDYVEVEGYERPDGSRVAKKVKRKQEDALSDDNGREEIEVKGTVDAVTESSLTVAGVTFRVVSQTEMERDDGELVLSDIEVGDYLEVEGYRDEGGEIIATKIEREDDRRDDDESSEDDDSEDDSAGDRDDDR